MRSPSIKIIVLAMAGASVLTGKPAAASGFEDALSQIDQTAPKYNTAPCIDARARAETFDQGSGGRLALSVLLSPVFLNLPYLDAQSREAGEIGQNLIASCGAEAFIPYFRAKAEGGNANAQAWLGQAYARGLNGKIDLAQAVAWYRKAADQGDVAAEVNLGAIYLAGNGVPKDVTQSVALWNAAAEKNSPEAETNLAALYSEGKEVPQDFAKAASLLRRAASQGHASAEVMLAALYEEGSGVRKNLAVAYALYAMAADNGRSEAIAKRDALAVTLQHGELTAAKSIARRCRRSNYVDCPI